MRNAYGISYYCIVYTIYTLSLHFTVYRCMCLAVFRPSARMRTSKRVFACMQDTFSSIYMTALYEELIKSGKKW